MAVILIEKHAILWADIIFVMEEFHKSFILGNFPEAKDRKIIVLDIPDIYLMGDPRLLSILRKKLKRFL